jgi:hypothetical protein
MLTKDLREDDTQKFHTTAPEQLTDQELFLSTICASDLARKRSGGWDKEHPECPLTKSSSGKCWPSLGLREDDIQKLHTTAPEQLTDQELFLSSICASDLARKHSGGWDKEHPECPLMRTSWRRGAKQCLAKV